MQPDHGPLTWRIAQMLRHATEALGQALAIFVGVVAIRHSHHGAPATRAASSARL